MRMFPISDPAREDDIRTRRRRAVLLLAGIVAVPCMVIRSDPRDAAPHATVAAAGDDVRTGRDHLPGRFSVVLPDLPQLGRLHWSVTGDALPEPAPGAPTRSFATDRLVIDLSCASSVTLLPKQGLGNEVIVSVRADQRQALQALTLKDGTLEQQEACDDDHEADFILQAAPARALTIVQTGDVDIRAGRFNGAVTLEGSGSGSVFLASTGALVDNQRASGDVGVGEIEGDLVARLLGSGDLRVHAGTVAHLSVNSRGSGDVFMDRTLLGDSSLVLDGSGGFTADRIVGRIDARSFASGDVSIASVSADLANLQGEGSGDIAIRGGRIGMLTATRRGSGDLEVGAVITDGTVAHAGSGDVTLPHASNRLERTGQQDD